ncbi:putative luciferase-like oxidoreductase [Mycobacteroides abscessus subsp. abscessus]|nr:putative luciferase-like oxidoreductase [Mycobacteroides abscessus subsp. abscessus]
MARPRPARPLPVHVGGPSRGAERVLFDVHPLNEADTLRALDRLTEVVARLT